MSGRQSTQIIWAFSERWHQRHWLLAPNSRPCYNGCAMIRIAIAAIAIAGATFSFRAQGASCLTLAQAKIETAQWQAVKVVEPVKVRTVAVEPAARERFDVVFYGGADRLQFERRWIRWVDQTRDEIAGGLYAGARLGALSPPPQGRRSSCEQG
jgi:hypothetical protein